MRFVSRMTNISGPEVKSHEFRQAMGRYILCVWQAFCTRYASTFHPYTKIHWSTNCGRSFRRWAHCAVTSYEPRMDVFFVHVPSEHVKPSYGPFKTRYEYNQGLVDALHNSRPEGLVGELENDMIEQLLHLRRHQSLLTRLFASRQHSRRAYP